MKCGYFGSCLSANPVYDLVHNYGAEEIFRIHHNRSDQFVRYFVDCVDSQIPFDWLSDTLVPNPDAKDDTQLILENQYLPWIGFENTLRPLVTAESDFIARIRDEKPDIVLFDNFMDVTAKLYYPRRGDDKGKPIFFPGNLYANGPEIDDAFHFGDYISPNESAENWLKIYKFFRQLLPATKFYFLCWSHSTSRNNAERSARILDFYGAFSRIAATENIHIIPPLDVPDELTNGPEDWYHMSMNVYKGLAGYIFTHAMGNLPAHERLPMSDPSELVINPDLKAPETALGKFKRLLGITSAPKQTVEPFANNRPSR